jgi:hypothetical protein
MPVRKLRAVLTAILLGSAVTGGAVLSMAVPALAATVSAKVGPLLKEAQALIAAKNYKAATAKLNEAEAVKSTPDDTAIINQFKNLIAVDSADPTTPAGAKAKFANDYNANRFKDVIADGEALRKFNELSAEDQLIIAQAYYKAGDNAGCVRYAKTLGGNETALQLQARCAYETGDEVTQRAALEQLVAKSPKPEYWSDLLKLGERARGLTDHNSLDISRLRLLTNSMKTKDDYVALAQFAMEFRLGAEAQAALEKGVAAKLVTDDRSMRLLAAAKQMAAARAASEAKDLAAANAAPQGDSGNNFVDLIDIGENMIGEGKAKDAVGVVQNGMKKPIKDAANAQMRLGQAYLAAGQKSEAEAAFNKIKTPDKDAMIGHFWALAAQH